MNIFIIFIFLKKNHYEMQIFSEKIFFYALILQHIIINIFLKNITCYTRYSNYLQPPGTKIFLTCIEQPRHHLLLPENSSSIFFNNGCVFGSQPYRLLVNFLIRCCIVVIQ